MRSRTPRLTRTEILELGHAWIRHFANLEEIATELRRIRETLDARLEHLVVAVGPSSGP